MKIYTKKGDAGETMLFSGRRVAKSSWAVIAAGDLDEVSAALGLARIVCPSIAQDLREVQRDLYVIGAVVSGEGKRKEPALQDDAVRRLEKLIDNVEAGLPELRDFIYPGESEGGARLHLARAITRRAERSVSALDTPPAPAAVLSYLNRLSDLLFVWARKADFDAGLVERKFKE